MLAQTPAGQGLRRLHATQAQIGGVTWYRVRVGRFATAPSAKAMESKLALARSSSRRRT